MCSYNTHTVKNSRSCLFCFDKCIAVDIPNEAHKVLERCSKYLHSAIASEVDINPPDSSLLAGPEEFPFCEKCLNTAVQLSTLIEQMEVCHKSITELAFMFSLAILHRRRNVCVDPEDSCNHRANKVREFDISAFPDLVNEFDSGVANLIPTSHYQEIIVSPGNILDQENIEIETIEVGQSEPEIDQYFNANYINEGLEIVSPKNEVQRGFPRHSSQPENLLTNVGLTNKNSSKTDTLSKKEIAESPLPIVRLKRLKLTKEEMIPSLKASEQIVNDLKMEATTSVDMTAFLDHQNLASQSSESKNPNVTHCSDILVNMSTMGIKLETSAERERKDKENRNSDQETFENLKMQNQFLCQICKLVLPSAKTLSAHEKRHALEKHCSICNKHFCSKQGLKTHMYRHTGERPFACKVCDKRFALKTVLKSHQRMHTGEKPYQCHICFKRFPFSSGLFYHRAVHKNSKDFQCLVCKTRFQIKSSLLRHLQKHKESGEIEQTEKKQPRLKTFFKIRTTDNVCKCEICGKILSTKNTLRTHMHVHTMSHKCPICNQRFALKVGLENHMSKHTGEKRYKCNVCDYATGSNKNLWHHKLTVHSKTKFKCRECGNIYTQFPSAKKHYKTVHFAVDFTKDCIITLK